MEIQYKSPNRLYKDSGTSLPFSDWIQREKDKGDFLINKKFENFANADGKIDFTDWIENQKAKNRITLGIDKLIDPTKKDPSFLGLNKAVLVVSGLLIVAAIGYRIYQKSK